MKRRIAVFWFVGALLGAASAFAQQLPTVQLSVGVHLVHAEVASTFETRATGLMFREALGPNEGMLFVFPEAGIQCMWMKNTLIPLSVAFLDADGKIVSISEMKPQTTTSHCAAAPATYALEMTHGWFAMKGIKPGVRLRGLDKTSPAR